ncbi:MAG TPA: peptidylprolyl isomerase [Burkholderiaceae bacterium]
MRNSTSISLAVLLLCAGAASAQNAQNAPGGTRATPIDSIAVVVNDDVITKRELEERIVLTERRMKAQNVPIPAPADLRKSVVEYMIVERAQMSQAREAGIRVDDIMLDRAVARIAEGNKMSMQDFRNQLEREGTPFSRFREEVRQEIVASRLREREVEARVQITDSEVDNYMASEAANVKTQTEYNLAQITVRIPENSSTEAIEARRVRAEEALRQVRSGADFAKMAATYSDSPDALKGGEIGYRGADRLPQLFTDAVANLKKGQVSTLLKSATGFHILKVLDRREVENKPAVAAVQQTRARHILIKTSQLVTAADARKKLLDLKERLVNKAAKFEDLAKSFSNDGSASKGGDLGWLYQGDTVPEFETAMNALQPGELSDPIESPFGFHLIEVMERKTDDMSKDRQRMAARQALRERRIEEAGEEYLRQLRDRAYVEYRLDDK